MTEAMTSFPTLRKTEHALAQLAGTLEDLNVELRRVQDQRELTMAIQERLAMELGFCSFKDDEVES